MTTDTPYWLTKAQRNPRGLAPIVYRPWGVARDQSLDDAANMMMRFGQWWFYRTVGKTFRRVPVVNFTGALKPAQMATMNMFDVSTAILNDLESRGAVDGSGRRITHCGSERGERGYILLAPGPYNTGNMIGFDSTGCHGDPTNPLWPRPGVTGLAGKGLAIIALQQVKYGTAFDRATETYTLESHADQVNEWWGALFHEIGHLFNLPHPPDWSEHTLMGAWFDFLKYPAVPLLKREIEALRAHPFFR